MAQDISDKTFKEEVSDYQGVVMVDFWAPWCGACQSAAPVVDAISRKYEGKAKILKLNVDDSQEVASKFGVMSIPTFIFFADGKEVDRKIGMQSEEAFQESLDKLLKK